MFALTISSAKQIEDGLGYYSLEIALGQHRESSRCSSSIWSAKQYRHQWRLATRRLLSSPRAHTAFVTSVGPGRNNFEWWPAVRAGGRIKVTNQSLWLRTSSRRVVPQRAHLERHKPVSRTLKSLQMPSAWYINVREVQCFYLRRNDA